ncbi:type II secretion system minor pseudopilin GspI [Sphingorhabdus arenilitoris]|uniref:Type II secretion system protein I n=1 Tax=Sphingorhabdus arenilitoris TaxID=1490041 RepID=A0ABV8RHK3_9SPHN
MANKKRPSANGFTLLEVLVALSIFSLAALALIRLQAFTLRSASDVISHDMAWQVARNRAALLLSDPSPPVLGESGGTDENAGRSYRWIQGAQKTDDSRIVRIDIIVIGTDGRRARLQIARPVQL